MAIRFAFRGRFEQPIQQRVLAWPRVLAAIRLAPAVRISLRRAVMVSLQVTASFPSCGWTISGVPSWITGISNGEAFTGTSTMAYQVSTDSGSARTAPLTGCGSALLGSAGGPTTGFPTLVSSQPCDYSLDSTSASFTAAGGNGSFKLTTTYGCAWSINGAPAWITFPSGNTGSSSATIGFQVLATAGQRARALLTLSAQPSR